MSFLDDCLHTGNYTLYLTTQLSQNIPLGEIVETMAKVGWFKINKRERDEGLAGIEFKLFGVKYRVYYYHMNPPKGPIKKGWRVEFGRVDKSMGDEWAILGEKPKTHHHLKEVLYRKIINHLQTGKEITPQKV